MDYFKALPKTVDRVDCADGSENKTFWVEPTTATGWNAVTLPAGVECKRCSIQVHSGDIATELAADPTKFFFSSEADGTGWIVCAAGINPGAGKVSGILGYVYTGSTSVKIAVIVLA